MNIWVNGCFDILHTGHLKLFEFAKNLKGRRNRLIVGIDSDKRVKELKGDNRPVNNENDRKRMLEALKPIDEVVIYNTEDELCGFISSYNIDYMVIGDDYKNKRVVGREKSKHDVIFYPKDSTSSTSIIEKIKNT
jgi:D-beta-D-heptose 7-phosphate kinase/D-beta-D-heptose 1-phosphate adenosyltransferase